MAAAIMLVNAEHAAAANLLEVYDLAAQSDPTLRAADATKLASREARPQALASFLPTISANASWETGRVSNPAGLLANPATASLNPSTVGVTRSYRGGNWGLSATESINIPAMLRAYKATDYTLALADVTYHQAELNLVGRVATLYFNVLSARDTLAANEASLNALNQQLERADKRFEVGLSAVTDVQEARASRDRAAAAVILAKRSLATNQQLLREVTGTPIDALAAPGDDMPLFIPEPQSEDAWVQAAMNGNLELAASRIRAEQASYAVGTQKLTRWPTLTLGANYTNTNTYPDQEFRNTTNAWNGTWFSAGVSVPLFTGGAISSNIRQAVYQQRAARELQEQASRVTDRSARDAYLGVQSAISQVQANKQALESSRLALQATEAGFEVGTRTTIDVLTSRQALLLAEQTYAQSRYSYITNLIVLKNVTGSLTREDLVQINSWLTQ